jgi:effector-binding domain-containing protein
MKIEVTNQQAQIAAAIKRTALNMDKIVEGMDTDYRKIMGYIAEQGKQIVGAPYCFYTNASADYTTFDIELGIPVSEAVPASGEIFMSQTYEGQALVGTHKGSYKDLEKTYSALMDYAKEHSIGIANDCYAYYLSNPDDTPESELLTQVVFPIK